MSSHAYLGRPAIRTAAVALSLVFSATVLLRAGVPAEGNTGRTTEAVQRALERLPYYGVFDFLAFKTEPGTVTLQGFAYRQQLPQEAEQSVKRAPGVDEVVNQVEVLPPSRDDDRIRFALYYGIYQGDFLSRYTPGGPMAAAFGLMSFAQFPGMQPFGVHAVHIVVKNRHVSLFGVVSSRADRTIVDVRARQVTGVLSLDTDVVVQ
jgi:hypothetical protein